MLDATDIENVEGFVPFSLKGSYNNLYCDNLDEPTLQSTNNSIIQQNSDETPTNENQMKNLLENVYCNAMPLSASTNNFELNDYKGNEADLHVYSNIKSSVSPDDPSYNVNAMNLPINFSTTSMMSNNLDLDLDDPTEIDRTTVNVNKKSTKYIGTNGGSGGIDDNNDIRINDKNVNKLSTKIKTNVNGTRKNITNSSQLNENKTLKSLHDTTMIDTALDLDSLN